MFSDIQSTYRQYLDNQNSRFVDLILQQKYRTMIGLGGLYAVSNGTIMLGSVSLASDLYISNSSILNTCTCSSDIFSTNLISNIINVNNNLTGSSSIDRKSVV